MNEPKRRRFQLSLRTLLIATALVAIGLMLWPSYLRFMKHYHKRKVQQYGEAWRSGFSTPESNQAARDRSLIWYHRNLADYYERASQHPWGEWL